jgi:prepilin-type N-terminal cleavage/methylation domain-containing protein
MIRRRAFTLIELLAASALSAMIMLVLLQVIASISRSRVAVAREMNSRAGQTQWKSELIELLRRDMLNATAARLESGRLTLTGHCSADRDMLHLTHEPVSVVYEVDRGRLIRRQMARDGMPRGDDFDEIVCAGVTKFSLQPAIRPRGVNIPRDPLAIPLRVQLAGATGILLDEVIVAR